MAFETNCGNGKDDDCDGQIDCDDNDCLTRPCSGPGTACCFQGPNVDACTSLKDDPNNCGVCGAYCAFGACVTVSSGGLVSGACECGIASDCPRLDANSPMLCGGNGLCTCADDIDACGAALGSGSICASTFCHY
jgi:hypothetical protein